MSYLKHKKNGQFFVYSDALYATGNFEKVAELPKKQPADAPTAPPRAKK